MTERVDKYWICWECAKKKKWTIPENNCNTVISGLCGHCKRKDDTTLIPTVDFNGPKKRAMWD